MIYYTPLQNILPRNLKPTNYENINFIDSS